MPSIETLADDIYKYLRENGYTMSKPLERELPPEVAAGEPRKVLRASSIGKCPRQLWFDNQNPENLSRKQDTTPGPLELKFLYGDLIEQVVIDLAKLTGHVVTHEQEEIVVNGITGHCDCVIDGVLIDIKSASPWAFQKYTSKGIQPEDDSFGYIEQLEFYKQGLGLDKAGWLFVNKVTGEIAFVPLQAPRGLNVTTLIDTLKSSMDLPNPDTIPRLPDEPQGTSGNMTMNSVCSKFCAYKDECWSNKNGEPLYRTFMYAKGAVDLTVVVKTPKVPEIFDRNEGFDKIG